MEDDVSGGSRRDEQQGRFMHPFCGRLVVFALCAVTPVIAEAQDLQELAAKVGVRILAEATSDKQMLAYTKQRMPYNRMSVGARQRANLILDDLSQYRRMPSLQYPVDPNIYQYLINHPDVAVSTWRAMGISKLEMSQVADFEFTASAADGSEGDADVLWRDGNQCLFIVEGKYSSPILPSAIEASALVWLQYRFVKDNKGGYLVNQQVETFIRFPSAAVDTFAKMASRLTNTILDRNVFEVSLYARMMSQASEKDPVWIEQVADRMDGVLPQRKIELVRVSRGLRPDQGGIRPSSVSTIQVPDIRKSGQFKTFELSMVAVKTHVPLVPAVPPAGHESDDTILDSTGESLVAETNELSPQALLSLHGRPRSTVSGLMDAPEHLPAENDVEQATPMQFARVSSGSAVTPVPDDTAPCTAFTASSSPESVSGGLRVRSVSVSETTRGPIEPPPVPPSMD